MAEAIIERLLVNDSVDVFVQKQNMHDICEYMLQSIHFLTK